MALSSFCSYKTQNLTNHILSNRNSKNTWSRKLLSIHVTLYTHTTLLVSIIYHTYLFVLQLTSKQFHFISSLPRATNHLTNTSHSLIQHYEVNIILQLHIIICNCQCLNFLILNQKKNKSIHFYLEAVFVATFRVQF